MDKKPKRIYSINDSFWRDKSIDEVYATYVKKDVMIPLPKIKVNEPENQQEG